MTKVGDQFAQNLTYQLLLSGTIGKQIAIGLTLICEIILLLTNLLLVFFKTNTMSSKVRKGNLRIGLIACFCSISLLILMLSTNYKFVKYLYPIAILTVLFFGLIKLRMIIRYWRDKSGKK